MSDDGRLDLPPCPYCGGAPKLDVREPTAQASDGWTRILCWNEECDRQPSTGWFRDDELNEAEARFTWAAIAAREYVPPPHA